MEKQVRYGILLGFYGSLLTEKQFNIMEQYYVFDSSLGEIAGSIGVTRQGVHSAILKAQAALDEYEKKLMFMQKSYAALEIVKDILEDSSQFGEDINQKLSKIVSILEE